MQEKMENNFPNDALQRHFVDFCGLLVNRCTSWVIRKSLEVFIFKGSEQLIPENR